MDWMVEEVEKLGRNGAVAEEVEKLRRRVREEGRLRG